MVFSLLLLIFTPFAHADTTNIYKVQISVVDSNGNLIDLSGAKVFASSGKSLIWSKGIGRYSIGSAGLNYDVINGSIEFRTLVNDDIQFVLGDDKGDYAFFISEKLMKQELKNNIIIKKTYKLSDLKKISLKANFMNRSTGKYEVSIYNPQNTSLEADNYGSLFEMKADDAKDVFVSQGKYNYVFKYIDKGVCAFTYKDNVSAVDTKSIVVTKDNVSLTKYSYKIPKALESYIYYIMHVDKDNHRSYISGLFSDSQTLDFYMDKRVESGLQRLILSKDIEDEYISSVWFNGLRKMPITLGSSFSPANVAVFNTNQGTKSIRIEFEDLAGNSISFIDMPSKKDMMIQIYDKSSGVKLHEATFSKYWDFFNPPLKNGTYIAKIAPIEKSLGIDGCSYYDLTVDSSKPISFKFIKLFNLRF